MKSNYRINSIIKYWIFAIVIILFSALVWKWPLQNKQNTNGEFLYVEKICELATLKCFYHDVAEYEVEPEWFIKYGYFYHGHKKIWFEYDGIIKAGIDASSVKINKPDKKGIVRVYVPEARVFDVTADIDSMGDPVIEAGILTTITAEDKSKAFSEAQKILKENAESDNSMLDKARSNAKKILEQYIINVGKMTGKEYTVEWVED